MRQCKSRKFWKHEAQLSEEHNRESEVTAGTDRRAQVGCEESTGCGFAVGPSQGRADGGETR